MLNKYDPLGINKGKEEAKPAVVPVRCAVCNGFGTLKYGSLECHACSGKGYILVPAKEGGNGEE